MNRRRTDVLRGELEDSVSTDLDVQTLCDEDLDPRSTVAFNAGRPDTTPCVTRCSEEIDVIAKIFSVFHAAVDGFIPSRGRSNFFCREHLVDDRIDSRIIVEETISVRRYDDVDVVCDMCDRRVV